MKHSKTSKTPKSARSDRQGEVEPYEFFSQIPFYSFSNFLFFRFSISEFVFMLIFTIKKLSGKWK